MTPSDLPLLELFTRLREAGLPLGIKDYEAVLKALQAGYGLPDRSDLSRLCCTLWVRLPGEQQVFDYYFAQIISTESTDKNQKSPADSIASKRRNTLRIAIVTGLVSLLVVGGAVGVWMQTQSQNPAPDPSPTITNLPSPSPSPSPPNTPLPQSPAPEWVAWILWSLGVGAISGRLTRAWLNRRDRSSPPSAIPAVTEAKAKLAPDLLRETKDAVQVAETVRRVNDLDDRRSRDRVLQTQEYLPITKRQMQQRWRYLRRMQRQGLATELDLEGTVRRIAEDGMFLEPVRMPPRINQTELILLLDYDGSMVAFHPLSLGLATTALRGGRLKQVTCYYFHNCPTQVLYQDAVRQDAVPVERVLAGLQHDRTVVLIFSDAGAARGGYNRNRVKLTTQFLHQLRPQVRAVAWLNPVPQARWLGTTAGELAQIVPMFESNRPGMEAAIAELRRHQTRVSDTIEPAPRSRL
jgi:uncharacterized protein